MSRMFTPEPSLPGAPNSSLSESESFAAQAEASVESVEPSEFVFVLGRRQIASVSLVVLTALAAFTGVAYMVGKSSAPPAEKSVAVAAPVPVPQPAPAAQPVADKSAAPLPEAPLFGIPEKDHLYLQLGSVERGFAVLMVHGARKVGFPAFVAGGTNPNVFRVLVGPFQNQAEYQAAKGIFVSMGLDTFSRKYEGGANATPSEHAEP